MARALAHEHWTRFRLACVVLLRSGDGWRVAAVGGAGKQAWLAPVEGAETEPWLSTRTAFRHWKRQDVHDGRLWVARVYVGGTHARLPPTESLCLMAAPFLSAAQRTGIELYQTMAKLVHDLKQPLATMALSLAMMQPSEEQRRHAERCQRSIDRQREMLEDVPHLIGTGRASRDPVVLERLVEEVVDDARAHSEERHLAVQLELRVSAILPGSHAGLRRAFGNVLLNAIQMTPEDSTVTVILDRRRGGASIEVRDQGPGVPRALRERIFQPFVTNRPGGSGLGLAVARSVARQHGGTVRFVDGRGGRVRFEFPAAEVRALQT